MDDRYSVVIVDKQTGDNYTIFNMNPELKGWYKFACWLQVTKDGIDIAQQTLNKYVKEEEKPKKKSKKNEKVRSKRTKQDGGSSRSKRG